jgi:hypothetical protein
LTHSETKRGGPAVGDLDRLKKVGEALKQPTTAVAREYREAYLRYMALAEDRMRIGNSVSNETLIAIGSAVRDEIKTMDGLYTALFGEWLRSQPVIYKRQGRKEPIQDEHRTQ